MAHEIRLIQYLQHGFDFIPVIDQNQSKHNTTNRKYNGRDITSTTLWESFNLERIRQDYGQVLTNCHIPAELTMPTPERPVSCEVAIRARIDCYMTNRLVRSLRYGFRYISTNRPRNIPIHMTTLNYDVGNMTRIIKRFVPDTAFFDPTLPAHERPNRAPGDIKPSYKWASHMVNHRRRIVRFEFRQALSQVNYYMKQHRTRYGYILTNRELVAIRRLDNNGRLELSKPILWTAGGTATRPVMTVLLGLWYLAMLAAHDQNWRLPSPSPSPESSTRPSPSPSP